MRYLIVLTLSFIFVQTSHSQIYEIGLFAGGSNFIGDVGSTTYIAPNAPAIGLMLKWNRSPRHAWRVSIIYADLEGRDAKSDDPRRQLRNYSFENSLFEISAGMEFTFLDFDMHQSGTKVTPYLYSGITTALHSNYFFNNAGEYTSENTESWAYGIPIVLGIKGKITHHLVLGFEVGARYTFSDELDGSVPDTPNRAPLSFGNINSNDWYVFTGVTLTYTFGQRPCFCNF